MISASSSGVVCGEQPTPVTPSRREVAVRTWMPTPFFVAPPPCRAAYMSPVAGACTTPSWIFPWCTKAMDTHQVGSPRRNGCVPSMGSTTQVPAA